MTARRTASSKRRLLGSSYVFFRKVEQPEVNTNLGATMSVVVGSKKHNLGVRALLYFEFSFPQPDSDQRLYMEGYAHVREFGSLDVAQHNPDRVYTWRKDLQALQCQTFSDRAQQPVALTVHGCISKECRYQPPADPWPQAGLFQFPVALPQVAAPERADDEPVEGPVEEEQDEEVGR